MKMFLQTLSDYRYTCAKADSSDEEPEEKICFSVEEGNMNEKQQKNRWLKVVWRWGVSYVHEEAKTTDWNRRWFRLVIIIHIIIVLHHCIVVIM